MDAELKKNLEKIASTIRILSMDGIQRANSGHPGLPLGCAELGAYLYGYLLRHNPKNPGWVNRDRLVLSAGHGSMWLYSCLHLSGFDLPLEELKHFRQLHSKTPGHPEIYETPGVEATTGPLGQGVGNAVGQALAMKILSEKFNRLNHKIITNKIYCIAGDGCFMEGVSSEASSLAAHLCLDNLILIQDSNHIILDGPLKEASSEDIGARYAAYGWDVFTIDGNNLDEIDDVMTKLSKEQKKPTLIIAHTIIGKGSPHKQGTNAAHGAPLGLEEVLATKENLGLPEEEFFIAQSVKTYFEHRLNTNQALEDSWKKTFDLWKNSHPELAKEYDVMNKREMPEDLADTLKGIKIASPMAGRSASQIILQILGQELPFFYGGSADLSTSDCTMMKEFPIIAPGNFKGRNLKFGIREFGMATIAAGMFQTGMILPYIGTFFTFSDYMRNAIRLASLSKYHVIYQFTHDSIMLGEDGPTHQPIEHVAALRAMINLHVVRPADANEVKGAWLSALKYKGPTAIILSRQKLVEHPETSMENVAKGAYILRKESGKVDFALFATGSEVTLALDVAQSLEKLGKHVRVVSMPCWELFEDQSDEYQYSVVGGDLGQRVSIEAGVAFGWSKWIGLEGIAICMENYGLSAPMSDLVQEFGFNVDSILNRLLVYR